MTAQDFMAEHIVRMGHSMAHFVGSTQPDMLNWKKDLGDGKSTRTALEVTAECVQANFYFASLLRGEDGDRPAEPNFSSPGDAQRQIVESAKVLADAVRNLSDEDMDREFIHRVRGPILGKVLMMGAYRNMAYHSGQINLIQSLGGDTEFHLPPTWIGWELPETER